MAIQTTTVNTLNTILFSSAGESAITIISLCNYTGATETVNINIVPQGGSVGDDNLFIKDLAVPAGDTFIAYQGSEKIVLGNGDFINATASATNSITAIVSYMVI